MLCIRTLTARFQSTLPARGATSASAHTRSGDSISIHAPRTGSDAQKVIPSVQVDADFNPRSPHGERRGRRRSEQLHHRFQSTLPARGATFAAAFQPRAGNISIHAPRTGSDRGTAAVRRRLIYFNPRSPHGERRRGRFCCQHSRYFNPRSPHGERRQYLQSVLRRMPHFNPRSPHGERRVPPRVAAAGSGISIHAPRTGSDPLSAGSCPA